MKKILFLTLLLSGCTQAQVKRQIATDLQAIVNTQNCSEICDLLKNYVSEKLNGTIPIPSPQDTSK